MSKDLGLFRKNKHEKLNQHLANPIIKQQEVNSMPTPSSQPENREQTFDEKLDAIIWELTDSSGWDLTGITQAQADALSEQLRSERAEAKQAIKTLVLEDVLDKLVALPNVYPEMIDGEYTHVEAIYKSAIEAQRQIINPQKEVK